METRRERELAEAAKGRPFTVKRVHWYGADALRCRKMTAVGAEDARRAAEHLIATALAKGYRNFRVVVIDPDGVRIWYQWNRYWTVSEEVIPWGGKGRRSGGTYPVDLFGESWRNQRARHGTEVRA